MSTTGRAERGARSLAPRAIRVRNACVRHAAAQLGLEVPGDRELRALSEDTRLRDAMAWWEARAGSAVAEPARISGSPLLLRAAVASAVVLLGLAFSYGPVQ
jgi:hypothetical protein